MIAIVTSRDFHGQPREREEAGAEGQHRLGLVTNLEAIEIEIVRLFLLDIAGIVLVDTADIAGVFPVANAHGRIQTSQLEGLISQFQFNTLMELVQARQEDDGLITGGIHRRHRDGAIRPGGAIDIQLGSDGVAQEMHIKAALDREKLFSLGILGQRRGAIQDHAIKDRHLGDVADIGIEINVVGHAEVGAAFELHAGDPVALQIELLALGILFEMIGMVVFHARPSSRAIGAELAQGRLELAVKAHPVDRIGKVVIDLVTQAAFGLLGGPEIAARTLFVRLQVDIIFTAQHVADFTEMMDLGGAHIHADRAFQILAEFIVELGDDAKGILVVGAVAEDTRGAGGAGLILGNSGVPVAGIGEHGLVAGN